MRHHVGVLEAGLGPRIFGVHQILVGPFEIEQKRDRLALIRSAEWRRGRAVAGE